MELSKSSLVPAHTPTRGEARSRASFSGHRLDTLTGPSGRALLVDRIAALRQRDTRFALLLFDLDQFHRINESLGPALAERVLFEFARRLRLSFRPGDPICRLGADEFVTLVEGVGEVEEVRWIAERVQELVSMPIVVDDRELFVTASLGVALGSAAGSPEELVLHAETAMLRARELGRASHVIYGDEMQLQAAAHLRIETDLRLALDRDELRVHYQPIVCLESGAIRGFEALARWQHPQRGLVPPAEFVPIAEETGLIVPLGRWVLGTAARQLAAWRSSRPELASLWISVNVSGRQLSESFVDTVARTLAATGLPPRCLHLELTETTLMHDREVGATLRRLAGLGVRLSVDDFGTGYSSLSKLDSLPIASIKIDRTFISRLYPGGVRPEITAAIVALGRLLGFEVVAEGIETASQLDQSRELGCHFGQGYYLSHPVPADAATALLAGGPLVVSARSSAAGTPSRDLVDEGSRHEIS